MSIADNVARVNEIINKASERSGLSQKVKLVGVTKTRSIEEIKRLIESGVSTLGENRVQEYCEKKDEIDNSVEWHIIGSLQTNKLKYIIGNVGLIQSVDSLHLAEAISELSQKKQCVSDILLELNISKEESKHGFFTEQIDEALEKLSSFASVNVRGLMMMAPNTQDRDYLLKLFEKTRKIFDNLMKYNTKYGNINLEVLSMGMSHDFELAVECGSNMVRLGRILFEKS